MTTFAYKTIFPYGMLTMYGLEHIHNHHPKSKTKKSSRDPEPNLRNK